MVGALEISRCLLLNAIPHVIIAVQMVNLGSAALVKNMEILSFLIINVPAVKVIMHHLRIAILLPVTLVKHVLLTAQHVKI